MGESDPPSLGNFYHVLVMARIMITHLPNPDRGFPIIAPVQPGVNNAQAKRATEKLHRASNDLARIGALHPGAARCAMTAPDFDLRGHVAQIFLFFRYDRGDSPP